MKVIGVYMRSLEAVGKDLAAAREALSSVEGTPAEVYSRIVGYYRSVRNWNRGKREEYGERRLYSVAEGLRAAALSPSEMRLLLFVRSSCPACPPAKSAAGKLGIPVDLINADLPEGKAEAVRRKVMSAPTAILLSAEGEEIRRASDAESIGRLLDNRPAELLAAG
jgi:ribonucleoside-triphosphate reductase